MKVKFCLLDAEYVMENEKPVVRLWGKTDNRKSILVLDETFEPYFYVEPKEPKGISKLAKKIEKLELEGEKVKKVEVVEKIQMGEKKKFLKVTIEKPPNVPKFRDMVKDWPEVREEYEYGISFYKRYLIDKKLLPMEWIEVEGEEIKTDARTDIVINAKTIKPVETEKHPNLKILVFDIEVVEETGIIMISIMTNKGFKKAISYGKKTTGVEIVSNEREMVERFMQYIDREDPDIIVTFNGDRYDFPRLEEAMGKYKIKLNLGRDKKYVLFRRRGRISAAKIKGRVHIDLYDFIEHILSPSLSTEVLTLDRVAQELIGKGKERIDWSEIEEAWKQGKIKRVADYCLNDSNLTLKLAEQLLPQIFEISKITGQIPFDAARMTYSQLVEWLLIRKAFEKNIVAENRPKFDEVQRRRIAKSYEGGYVLTPKEGIHEKIALFDFRSLYPSVIVTHNISPDTLECGHSECRKNLPLEEHAHYFCTKRKGFVSEVIRELIEKRIEVKNKMRRANPRTLNYRMLYERQYALKILANASYGYYAYPGSRWYSKICAETAAAFGRMYIKKVIDMAKKRFGVIYGDTDSLFVKIKSKREALNFLKKVNRSLPGIIEFTLQGIYQSGIFVTRKTTGAAAKKRYALLDKNGKITIRGFEKVRKDWANIAKETQEKVLLAILKDRSPEKAIKIVREILEDLDNGKVSREELVIYTQITKPLDRYEQIGPHVSAARRAVKRGKVVKEGTTIGYIITKGSGSISDRAEIVEFAKDPDPEYYKNNQVLPAALRVLSGLGIDEEDILRGRIEGQLSLEKYIKK